MPITGLGDQCAQLMIDAGHAAAKQLAGGRNVDPLQAALAVKKAEIGVLFAFLEANGLVIVVGTSATGGPVTGTGTIT